MQGDLLEGIRRLIVGPPEPEPGPRTLLLHLHGAVMFPLSRIMDGITDEELAWSPVRDAKGADWVPTGHDPRTDPFTSIAWRWTHFTTELHAIARSPLCLRFPEGPDLEGPPPIHDAASAVDSLATAIQGAAQAIAATTDARLDELVDNEFGRHPRRHWVTLFLVEAVHHGAEIGVLRDLYRLTKRD